MEYISTSEAASKWGISERRVRSLCETGKIDGVRRCGKWAWTIPASAQKPADGRTLRYLKNTSLKTGSHDFKALDEERNKRTARQLLTEDEIKSIISSAFMFDGTFISTDDIGEIFAFNTRNLSLDTQIAVLNMKHVLENLPEIMNEENAAEINRRLCTDIDEKTALYSLSSNQAETSQALFEQYSSSWKVLHPVSRASFMFSELMRNVPYARMNTQTAFCILAYELKKAKINVCPFRAEDTDELKAALSSCAIRGNAGEIISLILKSEGLQ